LFLYISATSTATELPIQPSNLFSTCFIQISVLRPLWEWNSTIVTIISFLFQDVARVIVFIAALRVIGGVRKFTSPLTPESSNAYEIKKRTQFLWKTLLALVLLECLEMFVKFFEVETICTAPYVTQMREKRHPNMTSIELKAAQDRCMLISDLYDYFFEGITIALLIYLTYIVHSYGRSIKVSQQTTTTRTNYQQDTSSGNNEQTRKGEAVVVGKIITADAANI
tara:strand:- start:202 stop:876 length:675 start_codon:yes stop_codon:yes gene_type:complete